MVGGYHQGGLRAGLVVGFGVAVSALIGLGLAEAFDVGLLLRPDEHMNGGGAAAALGVGLLVADIVAPVPSSLVMLAHGAIFGVVPGAVLSLVGRTGNAVVGVLLGRGAGSILARRTGPRRRSGGDLLRRWGLAAVVVTRPVPVLAESTLTAAGAMGMPAPAVVGAAVLGAVPEAVLYALAGSAAATFRNAAAVFGAVLVLAAGAWVMGARLDAGRGAQAAE